MDEYNIKRGFFFVQWQDGFFITVIFDFHILEMLFGFNDSLLNILFTFYLSQTNVLRTKKQTGTKKDMRLVCVHTERCHKEERGRKKKHAKNNKGDITAVINWIFNRSWFEQVTGPKEGARREIVRKKLKRVRKGVDLSLQRREWKSLFHLAFTCNCCLNNTHKNTQTSARTHTHWPLKASHVFDNLFFSSPFLSL